MVGHGQEERGGIARGKEAVSEAGKRWGYSQIVGKVEGGQWERPPYWAASQWLCSSALCGDLKERQCVRERRLKG